MADSPLIRVLAPNVVRVTHFDPAGPPTADRPWLKDVLQPLPDNEKQGYEISIEMDHGLFTARNNQHEYFFRETAIPLMGINKGRPYFYFDVPQLALHAGQRKIQNGIHIRLQKAPTETFYGWGEWFNAFQRKEGQINLDNRNALFDDQESLTYTGLPFYISSRGYGFLLLNSHRSQWNISLTRIDIEADGPNADYIIIYGPTPKEILHTYTALTGRPPLLPRWAFGLWATSYPQENQKKALALVQKHRQKDIPLTALILDYHWEERFHNFRWRQKLFPNPPEFVTALRQQGVHMGLILTSFLNSRNRPLQKWLLNMFGQNVTPGLENDDERAVDEFKEALEKGYLAHEDVRWWFGAGGMLDFTNPDAVAWWRLRLRSLKGYGAEFIKNDAGEDLPDDAHSFTGMTGSEYHNIYGLYYGQATYERGPVPGSLTPDPRSIPRPMIYSRTAWVGSQRYPALFMGDQQATFEGMKRGIRAGLNLSLAGFSYWTADTFGLSGETNPEVHMRYAQWGLLNPVARYFVRPEEIDKTRFPWSHNQQVEDNFRKYAQLRMRLLPYFNNLGHISYQQGIPLMRPMMMEFPSDAHMAEIDDQVMLGDCLMLCPVLSPGTENRKIVLPEGTWHDFWSENSWKGGTTIRYPVKPDVMPILVKGGSILPMGPVLPTIRSNHAFDQLEFHLYPPYPLEGVFFDEDGISQGYQSGFFSTTRLHVTGQGNRLVVGVSAANGIFQGQLEKRKIDIILHRMPPVVSAVVNGQQATSYNRDWISGVTFEQTTNKDTFILITMR